MNTTETARRTVTVKVAGQDVKVVVVSQTHDYGNFTSEDWRVETLKGRVLGTVEEYEGYVETRSAGRMYVNSRRPAVRFSARVAGSRRSEMDFQKRSHAIACLVRARMAEVRAAREEQGK